MFEHPRGGKGAALISEASNNVREARLLAAGRPDISVRQLDVSDQNELSEVIASSDVVVR